MEGYGGDNASQRPGPMQGITTEGGRPQEGFEEAGCLLDGVMSKQRPHGPNSTNMRGRECWDQRAGLGP